jgi:hypothetical protein
VNSPKEWFRSAARLIGRGFLLGIGFSFAFGMLYFVAHHRNAQAAPGEAHLTEAGPSATEDVGKEIVLSDVNEQKHDGITAILGKATNTGKSEAHAVHIQANLFDHGKFVDQYSTYLTGALAPGSSQFFKISCGCKDSPPAEHDSYKLEVLTGY